MFCNTNILNFQFDLLNTLNDQLLENVKVEVEGEDYTVLGHIPCPSLPYNQPGASPETFQHITFCHSIHSAESLYSFYANVI